MKAIESTIARNMGGFWLSILCCKARGPKTERSESLVPYHLSDERLVAPAPNRMVAKSSRRLSAFVNEEREHTARMVQTRLIVMFSLCLLRTLCFCTVLPQIHAQAHPSLCCRNTMPIDPCHDRLESRESLDLLACPWKHAQNVESNLGIVNICSADKISYGVLTVLLRGLHCPTVTVSPSSTRKAGETWAARFAWRFSYLAYFGMK